MFFFLSKTLNVLAMPLVIVTLVLLLAVIVRQGKWKKRLLITGVTMLLLFSNDFITNELMRAWELPPVPIAQVPRKYKWGIILSGVVRSDMTPADRVYFQRGADRVLHAFQLYKAGLIQKILISGGSGKLFGPTQPEADKIASVLIMMGARPEDILTENESRNTHESAVEVDRLLRDKTTPNECLLITSSFHMRRSVGCFAQTGWKMDPFPTDFLSHERRFTFDSILIPHVESIVNWHVLVKEWVGYSVYSLAGYI